MTVYIVLACIAVYLLVGAKLIEPHARASYRRDIELFRRKYPHTFSAEGVSGVDHFSTWCLVIVGTVAWPLALLAVPLVTRCRDIDRDYVETIHDAGEVKR